MQPNQSFSNSETHSERKQVYINPDDVVMLLDLYLLNRKDRVVSDDEFLNTQWRKKLGLPLDKPHFTRIK